MAVLRGGVAGKGKIDKIEKTDDKDVIKDDDNKVSDAENTTKAPVGLPAGKDNTITVTKTVSGVARPTNAFKHNSTGTEEPSGALSSQGMLSWTSMVGAGVMAVAIGFGAFM